MNPHKIHHNKRNLGVVELILLLASLIYAFSLSSCKSYYIKKYCKPNIIVQIDTFIKNDTVRITNIKEVTKEVIKTNTVYINTNLKNPCDSNGKLIEGEIFKLKNGNSFLSLKVKNGELMLDTYQDSVVQLKESIKELRDSMIFSKSVDKSVDKEIIDNIKQLSKWQSFKVTTVFDILLILLLLGLAYIIIKLIIK